MDDQIECASAEAPPPETITIPCPDSTLPVLRFDADAYLEYVRNENLTDQQARDILGIVWTISMGFVDLGCRRDPVQQALDVRRLKAVLASESSRVLRSRHQFKQPDVSATSARRRASAGPREDS